MRFLWPWRSFPKLNHIRVTLLYEDTDELLDALVDHCCRHILPADRRLQGDRHDLQRGIVYLQHLIFRIYSGELHQRQEQVASAAIIVTLWQLVLREVEHCFDSCGPLPPVLRVG